LKKNILITLCARGGSKGIPRKNIRLLAGKPLIKYSYDHAVEFGNWLLEKYGTEVDIALSTDSKEIQEVCASFGLHTNYTRPDFLANDSAGKLDAIKDVIHFEEENRGKNYDYIIDLDISAPLRTQKDLQEAYAQFLENPLTENLFSVNHAHKNPYFNMVEKREDGCFDLSKKQEQVLSRQTAPQVYEMNASFYFYKRSFFNKEKLYLFDHADIYLMHHISFDLDELVDFEFLDFLVTQEKLAIKI
jgi:CMP-N-acetylneuraminic acid synthetase